MCRVESRLNTVKTITFVRHAQSEANAGGVTQPHHSIPLSDLGRRQAKELAQSLEITPSQILVSEFVRTAETAAPFCERVGMESKVHPLLNEFSSIDSALLAGMRGAQRRPIADAYWERRDPDLRMGPRAETFAEFDLRVSQFVGALDSLPSGTLIFGHGQFLALTIWRLQRIGDAGPSSMSDFRKFQTALPMPNCAIYTIKNASDGGWVATAGP